MTVSHVASDATESTPLLNGSPSQPIYTHTHTHDAGSNGPDPNLLSSSFTAEDSSAFLGLTRVTSIPQGPDIEPTLETIPPAPEDDVKDNSDPEAGQRPEVDAYASRFINVSPMRFWLIFGGVMMGYIIGFFDSTLMASSHPVITSHFHASNSASWLSTAFLLTSTAFLPLFGRISDTVGRKPVYLFAIAVFFITTAWCAAAQSMLSFIAARAFCGMGAGGVFSMGMILSSDLVRLEYRGVYQSYVNLCLGLGGFLGLAFGGYLCDQVGWRGAFLVQLPFIFIYFIVAAWTVPADLGRKRAKTERLTFMGLLKNIDLVGSLLLVLAVTALIMGLNLGGNIFSWTHPIVVTSLVSFVVFAVLFVRYERNVERGVMPISLLLKEPRASLIFGNFFGAISVNTMVFNAPLYFQAVKLASPTDSGLRLLASTLAVTTSSVATGFLITRTKQLKPTVMIGDVCMLIGGIAAATMGVGTPDVIAMMCVALTSLGQGFAFPSLMVSVLATSEQEDQAVATTTLGLWRNLGSVMGVATSSWIFQNSLLYELDERVTGTNKADIILLVRKSVQAIAKLDPLSQHQVIGAYAAALRVTFFSAAVWAALMLLLHLRVRLPRLGSKA
ncbi:putative MFS multidrug transporter [Aspergillus brunneoviolaceus CBS 621.78]|uniref:MFS general substrate transporter n=1 Tax=Aspergillus brunneoviolaceus CBS 621.78 TaxID=1450534 RepID=A0ACD1G5J6_9EURO|nr:MFS general substrate transporter [Aspergillus brunneoviolaceus CBS 621.78]RAH44511.1 MFS general substrate transporter [Aspergillus brunneoviolaceus CBS 621.78]